MDHSIGKAMAPESTGGARLCSRYRSATLPTSGRAGRESRRLRRGAL